MYNQISPQGLPFNTKIIDADISGGYLDKAQKSEHLPSWWEESNRENSGFSIFNSELNDDPIIHHKHPLKFLLLSTEEIFYFEQVSNIKVKELCYIGRIRLNSVSFIRLPTLNSVTFDYSGKNFYLTETNFGQIYNCKLTGWKKKLGKKSGPHAEASEKSSWKNSDSKNIHLAHQNVMNASASKIENLYRVEKYFTWNNCSIYKQVDSKSLCQKYLNYWEILDTEKKDSWSDTLVMKSDNSDEGTEFDRHINVKNRKLAAKSIFKNLHGKWDKFNRNLVENSIKSSLFDVKSKGSGD